MELDNAMQTSHISILKASGDFPVGRRLAQGIMQFFRRQLAQVMAWIGRWARNDMMAANKPDLSVWTEPMAEMGGNFLLPPFVRGGNDMARRISLVLPGGTLSPKEIFQAIHPKVPLAVDRLALDFCDETNDTSTKRLDLALHATREEIKEGLELGETLPKLSERVGKIFDSKRAVDIARNESARAMMSGQHMAAVDSGVVIGKRWLAKSDACPICKALNGKVVGMDEDFAYDAKAKAAYRAVPYPPRHVNCTCSWSPIIDPKVLKR